MARGWVGLAVLFACLVLEPPEAKAFEVCPTECVLVYGVVFGLGIAIAPPLTFIMAEVAYGDELRWFPVGWAVPELIYGGAMTLLLSVALQQTNARESAAIIPLIALSSWFTLHAVLSLVIGDRGPRRDEPKRPASGTARFVAAPIQDGVWAGVSGYL
jgi:hypothetical protein